MSTTEWRHDDPGLDRGALEAADTSGVDPVPVVDPVLAAIADGLKPAAASEGDAEKVTMANAWRTPLRSNKAALAAASKKRGRR